MDALEKMHADATGVQGPGTDPAGRPWLNQTAEVGKLVEDFSQWVVSTFGEVDEQQFTNELLLRAGMLGRVFAGPDSPQNPYSRGPWNTPDQLGLWLQAKIGFAAERADLAVRDAFTIYAAQLVLAVADGVDGDARALGVRLKQLAETMRQLLMGIEPTGFAGWQ